jgi:hypothetical protein
VFRSLEYLNGWGSVADLRVRGSNCKFVPGIKEGFDGSGIEENIEP